MESSKLIFGSRELLLGLRVQYQGQLEKIDMKISNTSVVIVTRTTVISNRMKI